MDTGLFIFILVRKRHKKDVFSKYHHFEDVFSHTILLLRSFAELFLKSIIH